MRYRPALPSRADGTLLPAVLVGGLALLALAQFAMTDAVELPSAGTIGMAPADTALVDPPLRGVPPAIRAWPIFAPPGGGAAGSAAGPSDPLGGAAFVGAIGVGRMRYAIVQSPGGRIGRVPLGGSVAGWRIVGMDQGGVRLARGSERLERMFGPAISIAGDGAAETEPVEDQQ